MNKLLIIIALFVLLIGVSTFVIYKSRTTSTIDNSPIDNSPIDNSKENQNCVMSEWSDCSNKCGLGTKTRTIITPSSGNGIPCGELSNNCDTRVNNMTEACCMGSDKFISDCPATSLSYGWTKEFLDSRCNQESIQMNMKDICPEKVTTNIRVNNDLEECNQINSIEQGCCYGSDKLIEKCQYLSVKNDWSKEFLDSICKEQNIINSMNNICPEKLPSNIRVNNDLEECDKINNMKQACCYGKDKLLENCKYKSSITGWDSNFFKIYCKAEDVKEVCT